MRTRNIIILLIIIAGGVFFFMNRDGGIAGGSNSANILFSLAPEAVVTGSETSSSTIAAPARSDLTETYTHPTHRFSFKYPAGFTVRTTTDETGELLVVQNAKSEGFQMHIQQMDEDITNITPELIKRDLPDIAINNPQEVILDGSGRGTAFLSDDPAFDGKSREVWFARNRVFYQITTYSKYDSLLKAVLETWEFK